MANKKARWCGLFCVKFLMVLFVCRLSGLRYRGALRAVGIFYRCNGFGRGLVMLLHSSIGVMRGFRSSGSHMTLMHCFVAVVRFWVAQAQEHEDNDDQHGC